MTTLFRKVVDVKNSDGAKVDTYATLDGVESSSPKALAESRNSVIDQTIGALGERNYQLNTFPTLSAMVSGKPEKPFAPQQSAADALSKQLNDICEMNHELKVGKRLGAEASKQNEQVRRFGRK